MELISYLAELTELFLVQCGHSLRVRESPTALRFFILQRKKTQKKQQASRMKENDGWRNNQQGSKQ